MTRDEIMHLVNETAPRYQSWGIEAHFQNFAQRLLQIEREACAKACAEVGGEYDWLTARRCAEAILERGNAND
jgi:hypothetical protein